jgi:hypothetical protein
MACVRESSPQQEDLVSDAIDADLARHGKYRREDNVTTSTEPAHAYWCFRAAVSSGYIEHPSFGGPDGASISILCLKFPNVFWNIDIIYYITVNTTLFPAGGV